MATFGERFRQLRLEKGLKQKELADKFFTKNSSISRYENNVQVPEVEALQKFAEFFGVSVDYLLGRSDLRNNDIQKEAYYAKKTIKLPILGVVRAGEPLYADQNIIGYLNIDIDLTPSGECFCLRILGDSMNLSNIVDGQLVLIRKQETVEEGEIALVLVNGENATVKKFYRTGNMVTLMPHSSNPEHKPRVIDIMDVSVKVIGKVVGSYIKF